FRVLSADFAWHVALLGVQAETIDDDLDHAFFIGLLEGGSFFVGSAFPGGFVAREALIEFTEIFDGRKNQEAGRRFAREYLVNSKIGIGIGAFGGSAIGFGRLGKKLVGAGAHFEGHDF